MQKQISKLYDALSFLNDILITCFTSASMYGKYSQSKISTWLRFKHSGLCNHANTKIVFLKGNSKSYLHALRS